MINTKSVGITDTNLAAPGTTDFYDIKEKFTNGNLEGCVIWYHDNREILFDDDVWPIADNFIGFKDRRLSDSFVAEIKAVALQLALFAKQRLKVGTIKGYVCGLKTFANILMMEGITTFDGLDKQNLIDALARHGWAVSDSYLAALNLVIRHRESLPFAVAIDRLVNRRDLQNADPDTRQTPVVPLRIYMYQLRSNTEFVNAVHKDIAVLRRAVDELVENSRILRETIVSSVRNGIRTLTSCIGQERQTLIRSEGSRDKFLRALEEAGVQLIDFGGDASLEKKVRADIGERVRLLRGKRGLLQRELAAEVGVTSATVSGIENLNRAGPTLVKVVEALGEDYDSFALESVCHKKESGANAKADRWLEIFEEIKPTLIISRDRKRSGRWNTLCISPCNIAGRRVTNPKELLALMHEINARCIDTVLTLTGMRVHELALIDPEYCIQHVEAGRDRRRIPVVTTLTTKITETGQTKNRVFVTTETAHRAIDLLDALHGPYRRYLDGDSSFFVSLEYLIHIRAPKKRTTNTYLSQKARRVTRYFDQEELNLRPEDIQMLRISEQDGEVSRFREGNQWENAAHQKRRSLVYYLVGLELAGFQELKEQLGHLSLHMTMYYGRNAHEFSETYQELERERLEQQAALMADLYTKIANGERIAGGKVKSIYKEMTNNQFKPAIDNRKMDRGFWKEELALRKDVMRVHALAPGIYCTNLNCDARLEIDFSEVVDCEFSLIDSAAFVETTRVTAMARLACMADSGDVYPEYLVKELSRIKSAEKILHDLGVPFTRYELIPALKNYVIAVDAFEV